MVSQTFVTTRQRIRKNFGKVRQVAQIPNLIELQKLSYDQFLQMNVSPEKRESIGLQSVFQSVFPVKDFSGRSQLEFVSYDFGPPEYDENECRYRGLTYSLPLRATFRLVVWELDDDTGARSIRDIKEQEVYMGDMPIMTENGTFVVNGVERVIVSQMLRSPGVFFSHDSGKTHSSGKYLFSARIIPARGSWVDFEFDAKDLLYVRIDRKRKLPVTTLLMALDDEETEKNRLKAKVSPTAPMSASLPFEVKGMSREDILNQFYSAITYKKDKKGWRIPFFPEQWRAHKLTQNLIDAQTGKILAEAGEKLTPRTVKKFLDEGLKEVLVPQEDLIGRFVSCSYYVDGKKKPLVHPGDEITEEVLKKIDHEGLKEIKILNIDYVHSGPKADKRLLFVTPDKGLV